MSIETGKCDVCGRFAGRGSTWADRYDFAAMEQIDVRMHCPRCTDRHGRALSNARPWHRDMRPYQGLIDADGFAVAHPDDEKGEGDGTTA